MAKAFITGASGFVGRNMLDRLTAGDWEVTALYRPGRKPAWAERYAVHWAEGDLLSEDSLSRTLPPEVDAVFHVAADTSIWRRNNARQRRVNVEGTHNLVEAALRAGAKRFIHTSTWNVYGLEQGVIDEDTPQLGRASWISYNRTKAEAEDLIRAAISRGLNAVFVNPSHIIGRYDTENWARMITLVEKGKLPGIPPGSGSFCHAEQVARAQISAVKAGRVGENYLLGGTDASFLQVIRIIGEITQSPVPKRPMPALLLKAYAQVLAAISRITAREPMLTPEGAAMVTEHPRVASNKAERELDYRPVDLRTMLLDAYRWLSESTPHPGNDTREK